MLYLGDACVVSVVLDQLRFVKTSIEEKVGHSPLLVLSQCKGRDYIAYSHSTQPSTLRYSLVNHLLVLDHTSH